ncbi:Uncharacterized protein APZ42_010204 [Daphnia magna]|uniref:Uncharacterized protein n=1 Tax=Daphnia magna TaxID=35525 RepID=A0A164DI88_9CRUS|nr:Uncharacterized protein APZ42_010204 [Daphnia magna]
MIFKSDVDEEDMNWDQLLCLTPIPPPSTTWSLRDGLEGSKPSPLHPSGTIPAL